MSALSSYEGGKDHAQREMPLTIYLRELRKRLIICLISFGLFSAVCYCYSAELVCIITAPAGTLYYMNPAEAFFGNLKVASFAGFLLALPVIAYQAWVFLVPALTQKEEKCLRFLFPVGIVLFFIGLIFSFYLVLPAGIKFFLGFATEGLQPLFSLGQYLSLVISFVLPFGFIFELPLFIIAAAKLGFVHADYFAAKRKVFFVLSFIVGAVIAPSPDILSQSMVAIPLIILYEASLLFVKYAMRAQ